MASLVCCANLIRLHLSLGQSFILPPQCYLFPPISPLLLDSHMLLFEEDHSLERNYGVSFLVYWSRSIMLSIQSNYVFCFSFVSLVVLPRYRH